MPMMMSTSSVSRLRSSYASGSGHIGSSYAASSSSQSSHLYSSRPAYVPSSSSLTLPSSYRSRSSYDLINKVVSPTSSSYVQSKHLTTSLPTSSPTYSGRSSNLASGLTNLGNTCYMNSVLQALFSTDSIRNYVIRNQRTPLMMALGRLFEDMKSQDSSYSSPSLFRSQFIKFQPKFRGYE